MYGYAYCNCNEHCAQSPVFRYKDGAVEKCQPKSRDGNNLYSQRDGLVLSEISDIGTEFRVIHQPVMQFLVSSQKQRCSKQ